MHRMFSSRITESARFLKMSTTSQNLYFHLGMNADDDGIVEAFKIMNTIGSTTDDLNILASKNYITVLDEDLVTWINDWLEHNKIRADRKKNSIYQELLVRVVPSANILEPKESYYSRQKSICQTNDGQLTDSCQPKVSKDKISKVKLREEKDIPPIQSKSAKARTSKHKYGEYGNVLLSDKEHAELTTQYDNHKELITFLDEYIEMKGYRAKNHYLVIKKWVIDAVKEKEQRKGVDANGASSLVVGEDGIKRDTWGNEVL